SYGGRALNKGSGSNFGGERSFDTMSRSGSSASASPRVTVTTSSSAKATPAASAGGPSIFAAGDKVQHGKWGIGTIVAVKGTGNDMELQ
ncbi:ATP-dependent DNA helicase PcrA, partial [Bacillus cereus]|nr:ATP-dependent DNA helicase PcrA [Bacillus cereus]